MNIVLCFVAEDLSSLKFAGACRLLLHISIGSKHIIQSDSIPIKGV